MIKRILFLLVVVLLLFRAGTVSVFGQTEPANNKFGIHLAVADEQDLEDAARLVNSSGGDWGYVTLVIQENDRDKNKWQAVFERLRELHLIPIIRLATSPQPGSFWRQPDPAEADAWVSFLNSLNWVIEKRYLVLFNEPNHALEWGNQIDPAGYGQMVFELAQKLKAVDPDFFILLAGFDAAAPQKLPDYADQVWFLQKMGESIPGGWGQLGQYLDGWASHSYPNHGFVGNPYASGRNSIKTYAWELDLLKKLGLGKELPVFITETGWPHLEGLTNQSGFFSEPQVARNFEILFNQLINDPRLIAITPFVLNYQEDPFDHFSWRKPGNNGFYQQYDLIRLLPKVAGQPIQKQKLRLVTPLPPKLTWNSQYHFNLLIENEGQAIWDKTEGYQLKILAGETANFESSFSDLTNLPPGSRQWLSLSFKTGNKLGQFKLKIVVVKNDLVVSNPVDWQIETVPLIDLALNIDKLLFKRLSGNDFKLLIYDSEEKVVFSRENVLVEKGKAEIKKVDNIAFGPQYRLVLLRPGWLPRQTFITFKDGEKNQVYFKPMLPLDFNNDGQLTWADLLFWHRKEK